METRLGEFNTTINPAEKRIPLLWQRVGPRQDDVTHSPLKTLSTSEMK